MHELQGLEKQESIRYGKEGKGTYIHMAFGPQHFKGPFRVMIK